MLETNDGNLHLEQAYEVFKAGKPMFIDKPLGATLAQSIAIYQLAREYNVPILSSSALRYVPQNQKYAKENLEKFWELIVTPPQVAKKHIPILGGTASMG